MIDQDTVVEAHKWSTWQRSRYYSKDLLGCFFCEDQFLASDVADWCDETGAKSVTALCPSCGIDAVVSAADMTNIGVEHGEFEELLRRMKERWF